MFKFTQILSDSNKKVPFSVDNKFQFVTYEVSEENLGDFLSSSFYLNFPLSDRFVTCERKKEFLNYEKESNYFVLDIDHIDNKQQYKKILSYFLFNDLPVFLIASRSFNDKDCFNMKGVYRLDEFLEKEKIKNIIKTINKHLKDICEVDLHVLNPSSYQAPTKNSTIILNNLKGKGKLHVEVFEEKIEEIIHTEYSDIEKDWAIKRFTEMGFKRVREYKNNNGSFQFSHCSERKTKNRSERAHV